jgi:hypothetical protein
MPAREYFVRPLIARYLERVIREGLLRPPGAPGSG